MSNKGVVQQGKKPYQIIEGLLTSVISPKQPLEAVTQVILSLPTKQRDFAVHWLGVIAKSNVELAYYFALSVKCAFSTLPEAAITQWINQALRLYDVEGLYPAVRFLKDISGFLSSYQQSINQVSFDEMVGVLVPFIRGLSGRELKLEKGAVAYTDTETLTLPSVIAQYENKQQNRQLYKAMACFLWAQSWFGTFKKKNHKSKSLLKRLELYVQTDINSTYQFFLFLEHIRLMACIERELPGLYRQMSLFLPVSEDIAKDNTWKVITQALKKQTATVETTFSVLEKALALRISLPKIPYLGTLELADIEFNIEERRKDKLREVADMLEQGLLNKNQLEEAIKAVNDDSEKLNATAEKGEGSSVLDEIKQALLQDIESVEDEWWDELEALTENVDKNVANNELKSLISNQYQHEFYYDEWDFERQQYKERWCRLVEKEVYAANNEFECKTKKKYRHLLSGIRKAFEVIKNQSNLLRNQTDGEEIDIDAVIKMRASEMAGEETNDRLYLRKNHNNRSFAVLILVDLSGSTKGWINKAEKESLILITEALEVLGDQYAIYGFSGLTRQRCEIYPIKFFSNKNKELTCNKIGSLSAKDYTRMGVAIRHSTEQLKEVEAKHKLLIVLSDGKPDDYDGYKGDYGIHDTRRSIEEAKTHGIRPFAITIDRQAQSYLPQLFGQHRYAILDDVNKLPTKLSEIYCRLTQ